MPQLSCKTCSERKVRCDKKDPCSRCNDAGIVCIPVHRKRAARGRHVSSIKTENKELRERLEKLESLVEQIDRNGKLNGSAPNADSDSNVQNNRDETIEALKSRKSQVSQCYPASSIWNDLIDQVGFPLPDRIVYYLIS
jgi:hypothetical protein